MLSCREIIEKSDNPKSKLICVFGCGGDRDKSKRPKMGNIATTIADFTIVTDDNPDLKILKILLQIFFRNKGGTKSRTIKISNRANAINFAVKISQKDDLILIAGKGMKIIKL